MSENNNFDIMVGFEADTSWGGDHYAKQVNDWVIKKLDDENHQGYKLTEVDVKSILVKFVELNDKAYSKDNEAIGILFKTIVNNADKIDTCDLIFSNEFKRDYTEKYWPETKELVEDIKKFGVINNFMDGFKYDDTKYGGILGIGGSPEPLGKQIEEYLNKLKPVPEKDMANLKLIFDRISDERSGVPKEAIDENFIEYFAGFENLECKFLIDNLPLFGDEKDTLVKWIFNKFEDVDLEYLLDRMSEHKIIMDSNLFDTILSKYNNDAFNANSLLDKMVECGVTVDKNFFYFAIPKYFNDVKEDISKHEEFLNKAFKLRKQLDKDDIDKFKDKLGVDLEYLLKIMSEYKAKVDKSVVEYIINDETVSNKGLFDKIFVLGIDGNAAKFLLDKFKDDIDEKKLKSLLNGFAYNDFTIDNELFKILSDFCHNNLKLSDIETNKLMFSFSVTGPNGKQKFLRFDEAVVSDIIKDKKYLNNPAMTNSVFRQGRVIAGYFVDNEYDKLLSVMNEGVGQQNSNFDLRNVAKEIFNSYNYRDLSDKDEIVNFVVAKQFKIKNIFNVIIENTGKESKAVQQIEKILGTKEIRSLIAPALEIRKINDRVKNLENAELDFSSVANIVKSASNILIFDKVKDNQELKSVNDKFMQAILNEFLPGFTPADASEKDFSYTDYVKNFIDDITALIERYDDELSNDKDKLRIIFRVKPKFSFKTNLKDHIDKFLPYALDYFVGSDGKYKLEDIKGIAKALIEKSLTKITPELKSVFNSTISDISDFAIDCIKKSQGDFIKDTLEKVNPVIQKYKELFDASQAKKEDKSEKIGSTVEKTKDLYSMIRKLPLISKNQSEYNNLLVKLIKNKDLHSYMFKQLKPSIDKLAVNPDHETAEFEEGVFDKIIDSTVEFLEKYIESIGEDKDPIEIALESDILKAVVDFHDQILSNDEKNTTDKLDGLKNLFKSIEEKINNSGNDELKKAYKSLIITVLEQINSDNIEFVINNFVSEETRSSVTPVTTLVGKLAFKQVINNIKANIEKSDMPITELLNDIPDTSKKNVGLVLGSINSFNKTFKNKVVRSFIYVAEVIVVVPLAAVIGLEYVFKFMKSKVASKPLDRVKETQDKQSKQDKKKDLNDPRLPN